MKHLFSFSMIVVLCLMTCCAELNTGLQQINSTLGSLTSTVAGGGTVNIGNKVTNQYEIKNFALEIGQESLAHKPVVFKGEIYNKTSKGIRLDIFVPTYDSQGFACNSLHTSISLSANEKTRLDNADYVGVKTGCSINTSKIKYNLTTY